MTPATNTQPVKTTVSLMYPVTLPYDAELKIESFLVRRLEVTAIDFYPAPAASGNPTQRK